MLHKYHKMTGQHGEVPNRDDLGSEFMGLDLQSLILVNTQSLETHQMLKEDINRCIRHMPPVFDSLKECRTF
jgi:hypothetical protein